MGNLQEMPLCGLSTGPVEEVKKKKEPAQITAVASWPLKSNMVKSEAGETGHVWEITSQSYKFLNPGGVLQLFL